MKALLFSILFFIAGNTFGQDKKVEFDGHAWKAPYKLNTPDGWGVERFLIPISFAPKIPYKGVEDIRFTPGWAKQKDDQYWSYAFLWYLDGKQMMDENTIQNNLKEYYTGLIKVNTDPKKISAENIVPVKTAFKKIQTASTDLQTFSGTVEMMDYMQQKKITLNCIVHIKVCEGEDKTFIFHELSPQPSSNDVWTKLDLLWTEFNCKVN